MSGPFMWLLSRAVPAKQATHEDAEVARLVAAIGQHPGGVIAAPLAAEIGVTRRWVYRVTLKAVAAGLVERETLGTVVRGRPAMLLRLTNRRE